MRWCWSKPVLRHQLCPTDFHRASFRSWWPPTTPWGELSACHTLPALKKKKTISETSVLNILGVGAATQAVMSVLSVTIWGSWWVPLMFKSLSSATSVTVAKLWFRHSFTRYQLYLLPPTYALFKSFLKGFRPYLLPATWAVSVVFFYIQRQHDYWRCKV